MSHFNLWLEKYNLRRAQIIDNWSCLAKDVSSLKNVINIDRMFKPVGISASQHPKMAFVDGGQGIRDLMGLAIYFIRSSAFIMGEKDEDGFGELFLRDLDMNVLPHDNLIKERVELLRDSMEFETALRCVLEHGPDTVVLDGSLFVKAFKKPIDCDEYKRYRQSFEALLRACKQMNTTLLGVSEDSKSRLFTKHLTKTQSIGFPPYMTDSTILRILSPYHAFRTVPFIPEKSMSIIKNRSMSREEFPTAYLQPNANSNPLRIDILGDKDSLVKNIDIIADLCKGSGTYGYPLPLYYSHMDAHIPTKQMDWTVNQIVNYVSRFDGTLADAIMRSPRRMCRPS